MRRLADVNSAVSELPTCGSEIALPVQRSDDVKTLPRVGSTAVFLTLSLPLPLPLPQEIPAFPSSHLPLLDQNPMGFVRTLSEKKNRRK